MSSSSYPAAAAAAASTMMMLMLLSSSLALITLLQDTTTIVIMSEAAAASPPPPLPPPSCSPSSHSSPSNLSPPLACVVTTAAASADVEIHYGISHTALSIAMLLPSKAANAWYALGFPAHADACGNSRCGMAPASAVIGSNNVVEPALLTAYANPERTNAWLPTTSGTETSLEDTTVVMWATVDIASIPELAAVPSNATEVSLLWAFGVGNAFDDGFASYHVQNRGVVTIPWAPTFVDPAPAPAPAPEVQSEEEPTPEESAEITFLGSIKQGQSPNSISTESSSTLACTKSSPASILPESLVSSFDPPLECVVESGDIQIHYGISETLLTVAMILPSSAASGWYALGFPANANTCAPNCPMAPADAMVADSATGVVAPARLVGYSNPIKAQDWSPTTSGTSSLDGGQHVMWATVEIASVPELASTMAESASSSMGVLWAYGPGDAFDAGFGAYHNRNKGVISLPLGGGGGGGGGGTAPAPSSSRRPPSFFWQVHGAMMVSAWAGLLPAGVALAGALRRAGDGATKAGLFWSHVAAQITGVTLGTAALVVVGVGGSRGWDPGSTPLHHGSVGVAVMVVAWVQVMGGVARPHAGGGRLRLAWEWAHLIMGVGCVVAALWCIVTGSSLLALYVPGVRAEVWWGVAAGVVGGVVLAGGVVKRTVVA